MSADSAHRSDRDTPSARGIRSGVPQGGAGLFVMMSAESLHAMPNKSLSAFTEFPER